MLGIEPQLQHKGGEDVSSFVTMWPGTLTYFKMENRMPGMNTTWALQGPWIGCSQPSRLQSRAIGLNGNIPPPPPNTHTILYILGIGFLQQRSPELIGFCWVHEDQAIIIGRQAVVNDDILPFPITPELEVEDASIILVKRLFWGYDPV